MACSRKVLIEFPCTILVDTREQRPYSFAGIRADANEGGGPVFVRTARSTLYSGDYSLSGLTDRVAIERKSLADLFGTLGKGRERFERELMRLDQLDFACVMAEAEWSEIFNNPPSHSRLPPKVVFRSVISWQQRFPRVHWMFAPDRETAEVMTFRILERFHKEH